jgi:plasmid stabilization system protein ParE
MAVIFSSEAGRTLQEIRAYIAKDKPIAASRTAVELVAACDRLEQFPERGRPGPRPHTRELTTVWPYVILNRIRGLDIFILSIRHGARKRSG